MNNSEYGTLVHGHSIRFDRQFPGSAEYVWCFLTTKVLLATWIGEGQFDCKIGGDVRLHATGSSIRGVITFIKPYKKLIYRWIPVANDASCDLVAGIESYVTFELNASREGTRMRVTHTPVLKSQHIRTLAFWHSLLDRLAACVLQLDPQPFSKRFIRLLDEYDARMTAFGRHENVGSPQSGFRAPSLSLASA
jgi:uncharacterized protein YndB with AHSA1/START domain